MGRGRGRKKGYGEGKYREGFEETQAAVRKHG